MVFIFRHSVEECRSEMHNMETHINNRETEKTELEKEVNRLIIAVDNEGTIESPHSEHQEELQKQQQQQKQSLRQQEELRQQRQQEKQNRQEQLR